MNYLVSDLTTWTAYWANTADDAKDATDRSALEFITNHPRGTVRTGSVIVTAAEHVTDRRALQGGFAIGELFTI